MRVYYWAAKNKIVVACGWSLIKFDNDKSDLFTKTHTRSRVPKTLVLLGDL